MERLQNKAGHPYGIIAMFQLYEIASYKGEVESNIGILFSLYKKIREGIWLISQPVYDFYITEIESILNNKLINDKFPEIQRSYSEMQKQPSPYGQKLLFADFLERNVIPEIKDRMPSHRQGPGLFRNGFGEMPVMIYFWFHTSSYPMSNRAKRITAACTGILVF